MNLCFLIGKIISEIDYKFILDSKNIAIAMFEIQIRNQSIIKIKAYDGIADWCYQKLVEGDKVWIEGNLNNKREVIINFLNKIG